MSNPTPQNTTPGDSVDAKPEAETGAPQQRQQQPDAQAETRDSESAQTSDATPTADSTPVPAPVQEPVPTDTESIDLQERVIAAIRNVYDPEIPVNVYDLGLIYQVNANAKTGRVAILMTLTTPNCPEAQVIPGHVRTAAESIPQTKEADVQVIWDPPWTPDRMSEEARLELGMF